MTKTAKTEAATPAADEIAKAIAIIAKLDNKQLKVLSEAVSNRRRVNIKANKEATAKKKAEAEKKRAAKLKELEAKAAPLNELIGTAQEELFAERVAKAAKPVLAFVMKSDFKPEEIKAMKVAELRDAAKTAFKLHMNAAIQNAKKGKKAA